MKPIVFCVLAGLIVFGLAAGDVWAQATAQIAGTVRDQSGAVLPGVEVTLTQTETGVTRSATTNEAGSYVLSNLPIGPYRLEAALAGFRTFVQTGITLVVNAAPVINPVLQIGQVSEQVEVQANATLVETHSTGVGELIDSQRVVELPLNGRQATQLINLAGAAATIPLANVGQLYSGKNNPDETPIAVAGGGANSALTYMLDGGTHNDPINNLGLPLPFPDALQEFKVETSALPAQYGQHGSGAVNVVTKSGTNDFHGNLFEFVRNGAFNARDFFAPVRDSLKRNQFGGTIGGPIVHNKLFFFGGTQFTIQRSAPVTGTNYIPTPAMLVGDFTKITSPACNNGKQITLKTPFVNNTISASQLSAPALKMLTYGYGTAEDDCGTVHFGSLNSFSSQYGVGKMDYQINAQHSIFGRYFGAHSFAPPTYTGTPLSITQPSPDNMVTSAVLGDTYVISSRTINSLRVAFNKSSIEKTQVPFFGASDLGIQGITEIIPKYLLVTVTNALYSAAGATYPGYLYTTTYQIADDVSLIRGNHQIQFGGNYVRPLHKIWIYLNTAGAFTFNGQVTGLPMADFLIGSPSSFAQNTISNDRERQRNLGLYAQDSWRVTPRLTLNYGLRWDPYFGTVIPNGWVSHFDMNAFLNNVHSTVYPNAPAGTLFPGDPNYGAGDRPMKTRLKDFAPRIGLAWDPQGNGRMTVRASWGMFYDFPSTLFYYGYSNEPPWGQAITYNSPPGGFSDPWRSFPGGNPFPYTFSKNSVFPSQAPYVTVPLSYHPPYLNQWNLSVEKQIGANWLAKASYLGSNTIHFWSPKALNPSQYIPGNCVAGQYGLAAPGPCSTTTNPTQRRVLTLANPSQGPYYNSIVNLDDGGTANYNGLLLSLQHRLSNHFTVQSNYTWSHCIADLGTTLLAGSYTDPNNRRSDRGQCAGTDLRHIFNLSAVLQGPTFSQRALRTVASNWQLAIIGSVHSGIPFSATSGIDTDLNGVGGDRATQILANPYCEHKTINCWLNGAAFATPVANGIPSNMKPFTLVGPGFFNMDLALTRSIRLGERQRVDLRAEAFNFANHANFLTNSPNNPSAVSTGQQNGAAFGKILYDVGPRIMQFAVKYAF
ncbi:MAG TPA: TonB-dependent receptor [Terriglobia bacterium]|nr:TonB-dependent receptor [Terriglobia bacterium]